ncbi:MAG: RsmD family RNA methyltransferase [Vicinamibacterales bacterium]
MCGDWFAHATYPLQLTLKQQIIDDAFRRIGRLPLASPPPVAASPTDGYRMRARCHVAQGTVGFFREGTHDICDPGDTAQLVPAACAVLARVAEVLQRHPRAVEAVDLAENREATERAVHLSLARDADPSGLGPLASLADVTGVSYGHAGSPRVHVLAGERFVRDRFVRSGRTWDLRRDVRAFFQGNRFLLDALVTHVVDAVHEGAVLDLYAGVGLFAMAAASEGRGPVVAVEGDPIAAADLRRQASAGTGAVDARHESVEAFLERRRRGPSPRTVIVDPPRTGLSRGAMSGVVALGAPRVIYVSCDVPTLARDVRTLSEAGYHVMDLAAFDLFPRTAHVEVVVRLDRDPGAGGRSVPGS